MSSFRAPKEPPALSQMLADLSRPHPSKIARLLGVHERTVYGWQAQDQAPRAALLALFWETSWGRQWHHANAENDARFYAQHLAALTSENERLRQRVAYLESVGQFESANAPTFTPTHAPAWRPRLVSV